jgi:hypothetical protein
MNEERIHDVEWCATCDSRVWGKFSDGSCQHCVTPALLWAMMRDNGANLEIDV